MTEVISEYEQRYRQLIEQAYIHPIRTVIAVDDQFPSLDRLIQKKLNPDAEVAEPSNENYEKVRGILDFCRNRDLPWLVDVHDGKGISLNDESNIAPHLHHSDLMILDYHLDGDGGTGDKAIKILREIAGNNHFNLVVVYTNGYDNPDSSQRIVTEIGMGLTYPVEVSIAQSDELAIEEIMEDWENQEPGITARLIELISSDLYLSLRACSIFFQQQG